MSCEAGTRTGCYIIAEMACSHEGNPELARRIIDGAGSAGADAVQFQIWRLRDYIVPQHPDLEVGRKLELSQGVWTELASYVRDRFPGMQIIACVYESASAAFAVEIGVDAFKLHSSDLSNPQLVRLVAETGKRIDLSVGASTLTEIQTALEWIAEKSNSQVWLMYGYQNFPTPTEAVNLRYMMKLRELFELPIGYQDHTDADSEGAFWLPAAAVGLGVDILEKHITHDRTLHGVDHEAALNPAEFVRFVKMVRTIEGALGSAVPRPFSGEEVKYRKYAKKSLVAARDLSAGDLIMEQDLIPMRSDVLGLPPDQAGRLIGRALTKSVAQFYVVREQDVK